MKLRESWLLPAGYIDDNGTVQLIPREFWANISGTDFAHLCDKDSCLTRPMRRKLSRLLDNKRLPRRVRVVVSEQHLQAILRKLEEADDGQNELG